MDPSLPETLRHGRRLLAELAGRGGSAERALDRLDRDLLPRTAGGGACLVAGIVGPNNAGKSALFNSLSGLALSPSVASGGATRRLVGVACGELLARLESDPALQRFPMRRIQGEGPAAAATSRPANPAELLVAVSARQPPGLLLIDAPDFDSIFHDNRLASESLLAVADLAVAVVTRHSYQNQEVVRFLSEWFEHGRPWLLVYNEAPSAETARAHAGKLAGDVGHPPLAAYWCPHDLRVARGGACLDPQSLEPGGPPLKAALHDLEATAAIKAQALAASLAALCADLERLAAELEAEEGRAQALTSAIESRTAALADEIAREAMPLAPFLAGFQAVLDRRTSRVSRVLRLGMRRAGRFVAAAPGRLLGRAGPATPAEPPGAADAELRALRQHWRAFHTQFVRDLGTEAREPVRRDANTRLAARLDTDLGPGTEPAAARRVADALAATPVEGGHASFQAACEALVEAEVERSGLRWLTQRALDAATLLPVAGGVVVVAATGGPGADLAVGGLSILTAGAMHKLSGLLGTALARQARQRWVAVRGPQLAGPLADALLPETAPALRRSVVRTAKTAAGLRSVAAALAAGKLSPA